ncbi:MAG: NAD-dependent DNA ligase LigA [Saprospiraceae bacterium]|nr:NAD-dependent DNA ligase LigA [Saprospiraceae bacterium]
MYSKDKENYYFELTQTLVNKEIEIDQVELLRDIIRYHEWKYYIQYNPVISDLDYDILFKKLKILEEQNPKLTPSEYSPTRRVSSDLISEFSTIQHYTPMLSLENSYNENDLRDFDDQIRKLANLDPDKITEYTVEPKYDGSTITLVYENDLLIRSATRGNGIEGDDITANAKMIMSVPLKAHFSKKGIFRAELRGECILMKQSFLEINNQRMNEGLALFANARNAASGSLRMKDPAEVKKRNLTVIVFQMSYCIDHEGNDILKSFESQAQTIEMLNSLGFKTPGSSMNLCKGIDRVITFCQKMESTRQSLAFDIDGMVIKVNDFSIQDKCGYTGHHPRWALAYKFQAQQAVSVLERVEFQVGKFGTITPVAKITPVQLAGVQIQSISLHNEEFINKKDLRIGDKVLVERAGEVIPYIVKSMPELRTGGEKPVSFPEFCPLNTSGSKVKLIKAEDEAAWYCSECACGQVGLQKMIFHVSKEGMNIDGFGESIVKKFWELGWLKDISDIYNLDFDKISNLEGFREKSAENLRNSIEKAKSNPIWRLLHSVTIKHIGKKASKLLVQRIDNIRDLEKWTENDFLHIKDIGPSVAKSVTDWFRNTENINILKKMEESGVNMQQTEEDKPVVAVENAVFQGKTILFTGTLQFMNRKVAQELAEKAGAQNISAVSKNLNILVVGENAGSKLTKAREIGSVKVFTEEEFINELKDAGLY